MQPFERDAFYAMLISDANKPTEGGSREVGT